MPTVSSIAPHCPVAGTALRPHYLLLVYTWVSQVALFAFLTILFTFLCPRVPRDCCIHLFRLWFCYYTNILRGNDRKAIVSASFLQLADM